MNFASGVDIVELMRTFCCDDIAGWCRHVIRVIDVFASSCHSRTARFRLIWFVINDKVHVGDVVEAITRYLGVGYPKSYVCAFDSISYALCQSTEFVGA